jgi:hypothetical protein
MLPGVVIALAGSSGLLPHLTINLPEIFPWNVQGHHPLSFLFLTPVNLASLLPRVGRDLSNSLLWSVFPLSVASVRIANVINSLTLEKPASTANCLSWLYNCRGILIVTLSVMLLPYCEVSSCTILDKGNRRVLPFASFSHSFFPLARTTFNIFRNIKARRFQPRQDVMWTVSQ